MALIGVEYVHSIGGKDPELGHDTVGATAVKRGDLLKVGASAHLLIPATAASSVILGVALHDAAIGAEVTYVKATADTIFKVACASTKKYVNATDKYTTCDFTVFTTGFMALDPATDASHQVILQQLDPNSTDDTALNVVWFIVAPSFRLF